MADDLQSIVQRMIDANESEENIASVIQEFHKTPAAKTPADAAKPYMGPDNFLTGFTNSMMGGEALKAGAQGGLGFLKGAVADLPGSIMGGLSSVANAAMHPIDTLSNMPSDLMNTARSMRDTTMQAGSDPEAFGRMMGQVTGQPLVTAGIAKYAPGMATAAKPYAGKALEVGGNYMKRKQPLSGIIPKVAEPRTLRNIESSIGGGIENLGKRMQKAPVKTKQGVVMPEIKDAEIVQKRLGPAKSVQVEPKVVPKSRRLGSSSDVMEPATPTGTKPKPKIGSGPFEAPGQRMQIPLDSRISGLQPEMPSELPMRGSGNPSAAVSRYAEGTGPNLIDELRHQAEKFGMSIEDYIASLRRGGGEGFVMPSAEMPRVR